MDDARVPPSDVLAEEAVLGSLIIDPESIHEIATFLQAKDFYREGNRKIYDVIFQLAEKNKGIDHITIAHELNKQGHLEDIGGGFLPDSIVGSITIEIDGKKTVYHYLADEEQRRNQKAILKQPVAIVHSSLKRVAQRAIKRDKALQRRIGEELGKGTERPKPKKQSRKRGPKKL